MVLNYFVRNQTIKAQYSNLTPRKGSKQYLKLSFCFTKDWKDFIVTAYLQHNDYSEPIVLQDNVVTVPDYFTQQDSFLFTLVGVLDDKVITTNVISISLDDSGETWETVPPDPEMPAYQQLVTLAEKAQEQATAAVKAAEQAAESATNSAESAKNIWKPIVDTDGNISWAKSSDEAVPELRNIRGPQGPAGADGKQGERGLQGPAGSDATVTRDSVCNALGYEPVNQVYITATVGNNGVEADMNFDQVVEVMDKNWIPVVLFRGHRLRLDSVDSDNVYFGTESDNVSIMLKCSENGWSYTITDLAVASDVEILKRKTPIKVFSTVKAGETLQLPLDYGMYLIAAASAEHMLCQWVCRAGNTILPTECSITRGFTVDHTNTVLTVENTGATAVDVYIVTLTKNT